MPFRSPNAALAVAALFFGCAAEDMQDGDLAPTVSISAAIPTVATVRWPLGQDDAVATLEYHRESEATVLEAPATVEDGIVTVTLLGLKPESEYGYAAVEVDVDGVRRSETGTFVTGSAPSDLPSITTHVNDTDSAGGFVLVPAVTFPSTVLMLDADGDCVWWHQPEATEDQEWTRLFIPKAILTRDSGSIVYEALLGWDEGDTAVRQRALYRVTLDGTGVDVIEVDGAHHDFTELPDGTLALLVEDHRTVGDQLVEGDKISELAPDGTLTDIWTVWDHAEYDPAIEYDPGTGWAHANALEYLPDRDSYLVSLRNFGSLVEVDRSAGDVVRIIGGEDSDYALDDGSTALFDRQHQVAVLEDSVLVFDNRLPDVGSRVVEYALDDETGRAEMRWEYLSDPPLFSLGFGDVHRFDNGNTIVDWSGAGQIDEVRADGEGVWQVNTPLGDGFGYMHYLDSLY